MSASLLSSFFVFIISSVLAINTASKDSWFSSIDGDVAKGILIVSMFANAIYFYYFVALMELDPKFKKALQQTNKTEWLMRLINQTLMLLFWYVFVLEVKYFFCYMIVLYFTFVIWNFRTGDILKNLKLRWFSILDVISAATSITLISFIWLAYDTQKSKIHDWIDQELPSFMMGFAHFLTEFLTENDNKTSVLTVIAIFYLGIAIAAIVVGGKYGFNPFSSEFFKRKSLH